MTASTPFVIIGASLAGAKAAEAMRAAGFDGPITLIGDEHERPYERPPLSKGYLLGQSERDAIFVHPAEWYAASDIDLRLGVAATGINRAAHEVSLADGSTIGYGKLLLATGSSPRRLQVPGADLDGVLYLRRVGDSEQIRKAFDSAARVAIVGGGWIGLETSAAARAAGAEVTVLEMAELPLVRVLGPEVARIFADLHTDHGVNLRCGVQLEEITGRDGKVTGVRLSDGRVFDADVVVAGVGITPNIQLAAAAGLEVDNGVWVDAQLRSSDPDIYAAGDVANAYHPVLGKHIRVEHWANALNQPQTAAQAMIGRTVAYDRMPYFFTDQYDVGMEYTGFVEARGYSRVVFRGDADRREFIAFWLSQDDRVLAGMNVNVWDVTDAIRELVRAGRPVDARALADPAIPLETLASS